MTGWSQALGAHPAPLAETATLTGNRGLQIEERLLFESRIPPVIAPSICRIRRRTKAAWARSSGARRSAYRV